MIPAGAYKHRRRGSVYMIVLAISMLVTVIGIASLFAVRVQRRSAQIINDCAEARLYARSAVQLGLLHVQDSNWRNTYSNGVWQSDISIGSGTCTVEGIDPDGVLNNSDMDPLVLIGTGQKGSARQKTQVSLVAEVRALSCLGSVLHAGEDMCLDASGDTINATGAAVSCNDQVSNYGTINGDLEAGSLIGDAPSGTLTVPAPAKEMPDSNTVFDWYVANGSAIDVSSLNFSDPFYYLEDVLLSPASNPYGMADADGIYVIDCQGQNVVVRNCRIVGTLVLLNAGASSKLSESLNWEPAVSNYPSVLIQGSVEMSFDSTATLDEGPVNFNPANTPYPYDGSGRSDKDTRDSYPVRITGLIYASGEIVAVGRTQTYEGAVIAGADLMSLSNSVMNLTYDSTFFSNPPPGFQSSRMAISPGSWEQVVD